MDRARYRRLALAAAAAFGAWSAGFGIYWWLGFVAGDLSGPDFFSFHAAARIFLERGGGAVYDESLQRLYEGRQALLPYIHPPYFTPLIAPLGKLDLKTAYVVAGVVNLVLLAASIAVLTAGSATLRKPRAALVTVLIAAGFFPLQATVIQGQSDLLMLLPLAGAYLAWSRGRTGWAGVLAGLALVKPQLLLVVPALFIARRAWRALVGMGAVATALAAIGLAISGVKGAGAYLQLVAGWAVGGHSGNPITQQTVYSLRGALELIPGGRLPALALLIALLALTALALSWRPDVPRLDFALAVAAGVALSPYENLHDLALLVVPGVALADLARSDQLRWPGAAAAVLTAVYAGTEVTLGIGTWTAAAAVILLAGYLVVERMAVRPAPIPLAGFELTSPRPHRVIVLPAYRAARTLKEVVEGIPQGQVDRILLVDDASADSTVSVATALKLDVIRHPRNLGYGGNQKTCYRAALAMGADVVVMLHPDAQYDPAIVPELCRVIEEGKADIVLGSRWLGIDPRTAGMPGWKRAGNRFLTWLENRTLGLNLSEFHTGYRAYSRRFLETIPFLENSDDFVFDTQVLVQAAAFGFSFGEVPAVGRYFEDMSSIGLRTSVIYGLKTLACLARYILHRAGFASPWLTPRRAPRSDVDEQPLPPRQVAHHGHVQ